MNILESRVICRQPGRYIGWPCVATTPDGGLVAVFSGDRDEHVCPFDKTYLARSEDNGATWSEPESINDTPFDDRDAGVCCCADGTLVVSWFTSHYQSYDPIFERYRSAGRLRPEDKARWDKELGQVTQDEIERWNFVEVPGENTRWLGYWIRRSPDGGRTWEDPVATPCSAPHGPNVLADGSLFYVGTKNHDRENRRTTLAAAESRDQGRTWNVLAEANAFPEYIGDAPDGYAYLTEPHVVEATPGHLVAMARHEEVPRDPNRDRCVLWQFDSEDGGKTWTKPRETQIWGKPPHLLKLRDGRLLVTYGHRRAPFGQRACFSYDEGRTWDYDNEVILRDDAASGDLGYPATAECAGGALLTVYYQIDREGEKPSLMMTRWESE